MTSIKIVIILLVCVITIVRWYFLSRSKSSTKYLIVSCFIQILPFNISLHLYRLAGATSLTDGLWLPLGEFGSSLTLDIALPFCLFLIFSGHSKLKSNFLSIQRNGWLYIFILLSVISLLNPHNIAKSAFLVPMFFMLQLIALYKLIEANFTKEEVLKGVFDGLMIVTFVQLFLVICYPILGMESVGSFFKGDRSLEVANKREGYVSAVGSFSHPGILALFITFVILFFYNSYLNDYKKKISLVLLLVNIFILYTTYSRTSYAVTILTLLFVYFINKDSKLFSLRNIMVGITLLITICIIALKVPVIYDLFIESDSEDQLGNRLLHWIMGYDIWQDSKWIGLGINSHVKYMYNYIFDYPLTEFYIKNPIHNIHIIALVEMGILGFVVWLYFFISRIYKYSSAINIGLANKIFYKTSATFLLAFFLYGFFGWSPFKKEILTLVIFMIYFATSNVMQKSTSCER